MRWNFQGEMEFHDLCLSFLKKDIILVIFKLKVLFRNGKMTKNSVFLNE